MKVGTGAAPAPELTAGSSTVLSTQQSSVYPYMETEGSAHKYTRPTLHNLTYKINFKYIFNTFYN